MKRLWQALPEYPSRWTHAASILIGLIGAPAILMTACASGGATVDNGGDTSIGLNDQGAHFWQDLGNGTKVECWFITRGQGGNTGLGGPTCDWVAYHQRYDKKEIR